MRVRGLYNVGRAAICIVLRIQHCWATLRRSQNKRNFERCWFKSLTGVKLCTTTPNDTQQHATGCAKGRKM